mmetsp:Transcript_20512/g.64810  ORF Transcript_20512/g.64810 Transcript_20512/m.64810 type:complete len:251 (-) Transcript_20512:3-755(-)
MRSLALRNDHVLQLPEAAVHVLLRRGHVLPQVLHGHLRGHAHLLLRCQLGLQRHVELLTAIQSSPLTGAQRHVHFLAQRLHLLGREVLAHVELKLDAVEDAREGLLEGALLRTRLISLLKPRALPRVDLQQEVLELLLRHTREGGRTGGRLRIIAPDGCAHAACPGCAARVTRRKRGGCAETACPSIEPIVCPRESATHRAAEGGLVGVRAALEIALRLLDDVVEFALPVEHGVAPAHSAGREVHGACFE